MSRDFIPAAYEAIDHRAFLDMLDKEQESPAKPLEDLLARFTYKPGWEFTADITPHGLITLTIRAMVHDADNPQNICPITFTETIDPYIVKHRADADERYWMKWLHSMIRRAEEHEIDEFFQVDGVKVFDPHK